TLQKSPLKASSIPPCRSTAELFVAPVSLAPGLFRYASDVIHRMLVRSADRAGGQRPRWAKGFAANGSRQKDPGREASARRTHQSFVCTRGRTSSVRPRDVTYGTRTSPGIGQIRVAPVAGRRDIPMVTDRRSIRGTSFV